MIEKLEVEVKAQLDEKLLQLLISFVCQVKELQSQAALFEVTVPEYALIAQCRLENKMLKQMWDYIFLVR